MMIFRQFGRTELLAKLTERSVEQVRSETAEHVRFGRTLAHMHAFKCYHFGKEDFPRFEVKLYLDRKMHISSSY